MDPAVGLPVKIRRSIALGALIVLLPLWAHDRGFVTAVPRDSDWVGRTARLEKRIMVQHRVMRVLDTGGGSPAVLLLHGWSDSSYTWRELIPRLEDRYRLIAPDWPGFGYSDKRGPAMGYGDLARLCAGLLDELGLDRAVVVGNSMGGGAAVRFAADFPDRTLGLVAVDAAAGMSHDEGPWLQSLLTTDGVNLAAVWIMGRLTYRISLITAVADGDSVTAEVVEEMYRPLNTPGGRVAMLEQFIHIRGEPVTRADVERIRAPTLILWGRDDSWLPLAAAERLHAWIPGSRLEVLDGVGHLPQWEAPQKTAELIDEFARTLGTRGRSIR